MKKAKITYHEYLNEARECASVADADKLIELVASDWSISARQYEYIRHIAIESAYSV